MRLRRWVVWVALFGAGGCFSDPGRAPTHDDPNNTTSANNTTGSNNATTQTTACEPTDEVCDGVDNDCDSEVDEGFDVGSDCSAGIGACEQSGTMVCNAAGDGVECDAVAAMPGDELCGDELDNDCDGSVDEGFDEVGSACVSGEGVCAVDGTFVCATDGLSAVCDGVPTMPPEDPEVTCDGLDNDCDGEIDEGCDDDADGFCDAAFTVDAVGAPDICPSGGGDCDDEDDTVYPGAPGLCDGKDNDCVDGVDDIKRRATRTFTVNAAAALDLEGSPIQAIASDSGFCFALTGGTTNARTRVYGHVVGATGMAQSNVVDSLQEEHVADVEWSGFNCGGLVVAEDGDIDWDAWIFRWDTSLGSGGTQRIVNDGIRHIVPSWDAALTYANNLWVVGYSTTTGSAALYRTLSATFSAIETPSAANQVGLNGTFPEFGAHPGSYDLLYASNLFNVAVHQLDVGDLANRVSAMTISSSVSRFEMAIADVEGTTWFAVRHAGSVNAFELRTIDVTPAYDLVGEASYTSPQPNEFITRNPFVGAPMTATWFLDSVDDEINAIADDGAGGVTVTPIVDPMAAGEILTGRKVGDDVTEVLWLTDPGSATTAAQFEIAEYTCY